MSSIIDNIQKNCLSYWYPKIAAAGLTEAVRRWNRRSP